MNSTTSKTIIGIAILAIALTIAGCSPPDRQVTPAPPRPQATQQSHAAAEGGIVEVGQDDFEQDVIQADIPVVVEFWASWCPYCPMVKLSLEQLAEEFAGKLKFVSVDDDANPKLSEKFSINHLPTIVIIKNGEEIDRTIGVLPLKQLRDKMIMALSSEQ